MPNTTGYRFEDTLWQFCTAGFYQLFVDGTVFCHLRIELLFQLANLFF